MREHHPTHRYVVANQLRHHVIEWDGGGRTTVLCLHGFLDLGWGFAPIAPLLAEAGYHVVAPDLRGHGDTDRVGAGGYYHFLDYVQDIADLVDQLARERLALVGHSMGGAAGLIYASVFPDRPERLVALESIHVRERTGESPSRRALEWIQGVRKARLRAPPVFPTVEACAERIRRHDPRCPPDLALFLAEQGTVPAPGGRAFKHDPLHLTRNPYPFRLALWKAYFAAVRCPVLLVDAAESELPPVPDMAARVAVFRDARRATVPAAGHMMIRHQPAEVARLVLEFLASR